MTDIVEFLTARLDEDEAAAVRAARPEPWVKPQPPRPDWYVQFWADERDRAAVVADPESSAYPIVSTLGHDGNDEADEELAEGRVEHIARHDPARGLREVKAKRALMALHGLETLSHQPAQYELPEGFAGEFVGYCQLCSDLDYPEGLDTYYEPWPCPSMRILASVYVEHPDYKQEWSVE